MLNYLQHSQLVIHKWLAIKIFPQIRKFLGKRNDLAYNRGKRVCVENYQLAADNDHPQAQFLLENFYEKGLLGLQVNYKEAEKWYRKSARNGNKAAEDALSKFNK